MCTRERNLATLLIGLMLVTGAAAPGLAAPVSRDQLVYTPVDLTDPTPREIYFTLELSPDPAVADQLYDPEQTVPNQITSDGLTAVVVAPGEQIAANNPNVHESLTDLVAVFRVVDGAILALTWQGIRTAGEIARYETTIGGPYPSRNFGVLAGSTAGLFGPLFCTDQVPNSVFPEGGCTLVPAFP